MSKQDRQGARTAADIERRYLLALGKTFAEILGIATDARKLAEAANEAATGLDNALTAEEIFNRLTNGGEDQGLYREDDKIYINASYIKTGEFLADLIKAGVIKSIDGESIVIDLDKGTATLTGSIKTQTETDTDGEAVSAEMTPAAITLKTAEKLLRLHKNGFNIKNTLAFVDSEAYLFVADGDSSFLEFALVSNEPEEHFRVTVKPFSTCVTMTNGKITGLNNPTDNTDAVNKQYVDGLIADLKAKLGVS